MAVNLVGKQFGRLVVIAEAEPNSRRNRLFLCICDCGNDALVQFGNLTSGHSTTCGCGIDRARRRHGHTSRQGKSRVYRIWSAMIARCHSKKNSGYSTYGDEGIWVCDRWRFGVDGRLGFECFLEDMGEPGEGLSIDRIDNAKGYYPKNCRWATPSEQLENRRNTIYLEAGGVRQTLTAWAKELGVPYSRLLCRYSRGWPVSRILATN